ncbi:hypothetical protein [Flavobacterium orientale]|uniref:Uncharacterized protein n=1 Tax=Flavobacterium orientale TaxID=1756020 RepID=A0A916XZA9_9FLAO|nr:hypothetical protein [Flavobacterium orientale]GGD21325.1 hypothetical protein GCM10011343_09730 [Flavobacterium orientale]
MKYNKNDCHENIEFRETFFNHVDNIKNNIAVSQDLKFRESVIFISNYVPVSLNQILNYSRTYPLGVFEKDRLKILEWYEENKCNNIQLKNTLVVPEVYQD